MKKVFFALGAIALIISAFAFRSNYDTWFRGDSQTWEAPTRRATAPYYNYYDSGTLNDTQTVVQTLVNNSSDPLWFPEAASISVQIDLEEITNGITADVTLQGSNQIDATSPTWIDVWSPLAWSADEDTLINITPTYAMYRLSWSVVANTGATCSIRTDWIVE